MSGLRGETLRYGVIGGIVALANNSVLIGGDRLGLSYPALVALTWALGGSIAYGLHARITFRVGQSLAGYAHFMAGVALGIPLVWVMLVVLGHWLKWPMVVAAPVLTLVMFAYNYINARAAIVWRWWRRR